ncbi:hypothetical protein L2E82_30813 [Cichorium intybus]|uniref:Uncharacterized protein n=1 Tax=Cichorium intybus TaxID=13427 RepID=A0ACB9D1E5_CICIN|nr:hypothetical protein L2E82_30813 [Cichorium intybus]
MKTMAKMFFSGDEEDQDSFLSSDEDDNHDDFSDQTHQENFEKILVKEKCLSDASTSMKHDPTVKGTPENVVPIKPALRNMDDDNIISSFRDRQITYWTG